MRKSVTRAFIFVACVLLICGRLQAQGFTDLGPYFSFHHGDGGLPADIASSTGQQTSADGLSVKLYGQCGPITGDQYQFGFVLYWQGSYEGPINPGDLFTADLDLSVDATGGDLEWNFYSDLFSTEGFEDARILTDPIPLTGGELSGVHLESSPFTTTGDGGDFEGYVYIGWSNYSPTDTLSVTIPSNSIDIMYVAVPEPAIVCALPLLLLFGRGKRRRLCGSD